MILWRNIEIIHFYHFDFDPRFPLFLLYVRWKSGVTFVRRCFRDADRLSVVKFGTNLDVSAEITVRENHYWKSDQSQDLLQNDQSTGYRSVSICTIRSPRPIYESMRQFRLPIVKCLHYIYLYRVGYQQ